MKNPRARRIYTSEFKEQALALLAAGRPVSELAQELGVSSNLRAENDILKKAEVILGTRLQTSCAK